MKLSFIGSLAFTFSFVPGFAYAEDIGSPVSKVPVVVESDDPEASVEVIDTEATAVLDSGNSARAMTSHTVCVIPCKLDLDRNKRYVIKSPNGFERRLTLPTTGARVVHSKGSRIGDFGADVLIGLGVTATAAGGVTFAVTQLVASDSASTELKVGSAITLGVGIAALVSGIVLSSLSSGHITVTPMPPKTARPTLQFLGTGIGGTF
jgi:hypothetical protein